jgi:hypothetical protein
MPADGINATAKKQDFGTVLPAARGLSPCPCVQNTWLARRSEGVQPNPYNPTSSAMPPLGPDPLFAAHLPHFRIS